jgi:hypothetical protein
MQANYVERAGLQTLLAPCAGLCLQKDGGGRLVLVKGTGGTGGYAGGPSAQPAYLRAVGSQRFVLDDAEASGVDAEETFVARYTGHLAGAAAAAEFRSNDQSCQRGHSITSDQAYRV